MAADDKKTKWKRWRDCIAQCWQRCLDLALVLWIVRVPLCAVHRRSDPRLHGSGTRRVHRILGPRGRMVHLSLSPRFGQRRRTTQQGCCSTRTALPRVMRGPVSPFLTWAETWIPRALGLAPYAIVLFASGRSVWNLPEIEDAGMISAYQKDALHFRCSCCGRRRRVPGLRGRRKLMKRSVKRVEEKVGFVNRVLWSGRGSRRPDKRAGDMRSGRVSGRWCSSLSFWFPP